MAITKVEYAELCKITRQAVQNDIDVFDEKQLLHTIEKQKNIKDAVKKIDIRKKKFNSHQRGKKRTNSALQIGLANTTVTSSAPHSLQQTRGSDFRK